MSKLMVEVLRIGDVLPHPNPEVNALDVCIVKGWQSVVRRGSLKKGDLVIYFPMDSVLPLWLSDGLNVTKYLSKGRIKAVRLQGEPSYGLPIPLMEVEQLLFKHKLESDPSLEPWGPSKFMEGDDLTDELGVTKWEPPLKLNAADAERPHTLFMKYDGPENLRNYPNAFKEGEEVVITEKIHGMNSRHALIEGEFMAGTHNMRNKENPGSRVWHVFTDGLKEFLRLHAGDPEEFESGRADNVTVYGEIYGSGIQDLKYGLENGKIGHRIFDLKVNDTYIDLYDEETHGTETFELMERLGIEMVPVLYKGPFSMDVVLSFSKEKSRVPGSDNIMEGVVIRPVRGRNDSKIGRVIMKYVFDQYLTRKGGTEFH